MVSHGVKYRPIKRCSRGANRFTSIQLIPSYTTLHWTILHCTVLHCTALHCTARHCTELLCTALHCTALHDTALNYFALQWTLHNTTLLHSTDKYYQLINDIPSLLVARGLRLIQSPCSSYIDQYSSYCYPCSSYIEPFSSYCYPCSSYIDPFTFYIWECSSYSFLLLLPPLLLPLLLPLLSHSENDTRHCSAIWKFLFPPLFTESAPRPIKSISRNVRGMSSPPWNHASRWIGDLWSKHLIQ